MAVLRISFCSPGLLRLFYQPLASSKLRELSTKLPSPVRESPTGREEEKARENDGEEKARENDG